MYNLDVIVSLSILIVIFLIIWLRNKERKRIENLIEEGITEKYTKLLSFFTKKKGAYLIEMSNKKVEVEIKSNDFTEEHFSIVQDNEKVKIYWSYLNKAMNFKREFDFNASESQEEITKKVFAEIVKTIG